MGSPLCPGVNSGLSSLTCVRLQTYTFFFASNHISMLWWKDDSFVHQSIDLAAQPGSVSCCAGYLLYNTI